MSYQLQKEQAAWNTNQYNWPLSYCIHPWAQLHDSPLRPGAHGRAVDNCLWEVIDIVVKELDQERWGSESVLIKN